MTLGSNVGPTDRHNHKSFHIGVGIPAIPLWRIIRFWQLIWEYRLMKLSTKTRIRCSKKWIKLGIDLASIIIHWTHQKTKKKKKNLYKGRKTLKQSTVINILVGKIIAGKYRQEVSKTYELLSVLSFSPSVDF